MGSLGTLAVQGLRAPLQHQQMMGKAIRAQVSHSVLARVILQLSEVPSMAQEAPIVQKPEKQGYQIWEEVLLTQTQRSRTRNEGQKVAVYV